MRSYKPPKRRRGFITSSHGQEPQGQRPGRFPSPPQRPAPAARPVPRLVHSTSLPNAGVVVVDPGLLHPLLADDQVYEVDVSVVLGTYNRLSLLRRCVESVRRACSGLRYEIVVTDGGSSDGTVSWLSSQQDVVIIRGDLSGAVPAFNAAAHKARGKFIVALNDDAELDSSAVHASLGYFHDPWVGQVAMAYRERGEVKISRVLNVVYANFPVTRASIVRAAEQITGGMWSTCYQTYGGDTELSCWVYRLGYKVATTSNALVTHHEHGDSLRSRNIQGDKRRFDFHRRWSSPDQLRFRGPMPSLNGGEQARLLLLQQGEPPQVRWPRISSLDPAVGQFPSRVKPRKERLLHWHLWTDDDPQASLAASMRGWGTAGHVRVDWTNLRTEDRGPSFISAASRVRPTVAFLQLQSPDAVSLQALETVRSDKNRDPSLVVCVWSGDVGPGKGPWEGSGDAWQYEVARRVDLMLFTGTGQVHHHRARGMQNAAYLQIGFDEDRYFPGPDGDYGRLHSVVFVGQDYGSHFDRVPGSDAQLRREAVHRLRGVSGFQAYGSGFGPNLPQSHAGNVYRSSLMAVSVSLTSKLGRYTSDRMIRSMACGCPTLVKRFEDMEGLGLRDGENCLIWDGVDDLVAKAREWAAPSRRARLREIGKSGAALMKSNHTWGVRVQELAALINAARGQP